MRVSLMTLSTLTGMTLATASALADEAPVEMMLPASTGLCLLEVPGNSATTRYVNLAIVQYVEISKERLRLVFGGGNFGAGYEADFPVKTREEALAQLRRIEQQAQRCQGARPAAP